MLIATIAILVSKVQAQIKESVALLKNVFKKLDWCKVNDTSDSVRAGFPPVFSMF